MRRHAPIMTATVFFFPPMPAPGLAHGFKALRGSGLAEILGKTEEGSSWCWSG